MLDIAATIIILALLGVGAGAFGAMLGVGGGIMVTPVLAILGLPPTQIASTSLFAVTSTSVSSSVTYAKQKRIDYSSGLKMAILAVPGVVLGVLISDRISIESFEIFFAILLILTSVYIVFRKALHMEHEGPEKKILLCPYASNAVVVCSSFIAGIVSSLFGVGGGIIFVPLLMVVYKWGMHRAAPTSQLALMVTSVAGLLTHGFLNHADYIMGTVLAVGAFIGAHIGARYSLSIGDRILRLALAAVLVAVAILLVLE